MITQVIQWWLVLFLFGIIAFPFVTKIFETFFDKGYAFAKIVGLICISYILFVLTTAHVLPFTTASIISVSLAFLIVAFFVGKKFQSKKIILANWKIFLLEEFFFFLALFFWSYIKSFQPDINGLEKYMDYGFVNSILRSTYFPPKDMWMTPLTINYYYFGHLMTAVATKVSFLPSNITFDLMLASLFAFTFTQSFSLGANSIYLLKKKSTILLPIIGGCIIACLITFSGNLHTLYTFFTPYQNENPVPPTQLIFSPLTFPNQYWYPNATRFIYHTIHEFPIYSFVVSDLHGHVLDIPAVLLMLALLLSIFMHPSQKHQLRYTLLLGFMAGIMYMTNAWDGLIYGGAAAGLLFVLAFRKTFWQTLTSYYFLRSLIALIGSAFIVSLPFSIFFKPFASQIGMNCAPDFLIRLGKIGPFIFEPGYCQFSPLWQLFILYGFFFFWFISLIVFLHKRKDSQPLDFFVIGLGILAIWLIIIPEFFYLKDIYTTYFRANTMFKLVYQSFILLSFVSGYTICRIFLGKDVIQKTLIRKIFFLLYSFIAIILVTLVFIYPYFAVTAYFNGLKNFQGLDGTAYLKNLNTDDYLAIQWLNKNIQGQPVVLEAQGDSYTNYERVSANTGLPTVFGWMVHEWLWRGTYDIVPPRIADVKSLYESTNNELTKQLLQKYNVRYVYIGDLERAKYPQIDIQKFNQLGKIVYREGKVTIYKIN